MSAVLELILDCEQSGVKISVSGQKLKIDAPGNLPSSFKEALRQHKADIIRTLTRRPEPTLHERLNAIIAAGASFDVGTDDFQVCGANNLTQPEKELLNVNKIYILCLLQQELLMKYLPTNLIPDYIFEVNEWLAIIADGGEAISTEYFEIVRDVTKGWFADLIDEMSDKQF